MHMFSKCIERDSIPNKLEFDINVIKKIYITIELTMDVYNADHFHKFQVN